LDALIEKERLNCSIVTAVQRIQGRMWYIKDVLFYINNTGERVNVSGL